MADEFDENYFKTEAQEVETSSSKPPCLSVGVRPLNNEEFELIGEMVEAIARARLDKVSFEVEDDETGKRTVVEPGLTEIEGQKLDLIFETYRPLIAAARAKGRPRHDHIR